VTLVVKDVIEGLLEGKGEGEVGIYIEEEVE